MVVVGSAIVPGSTKICVPDGDRVEVGGITISAYALVESDIIGDLSYMNGGMNEVVDVTEEIIGRGYTS